ncbi:MAG: hypothetical protein ABIN67_10610 [Ferruginibacter sp.]
MEDMEYIDSYFKGSKDEDEKVRFEDRIREDEDFAAEVAFYISANGAIKSQLDDEKKQRFRQLYNEQKDQGKVVPLPKRTIQMRWKYLVAASIAGIIILVSGLLFFNRTASAPELADNYIKQELSTLRVTMGSHEDSMQKGRGLYNDGKLGEALAIFEDLMKNDTAKADAMQYAGIIYLKQEKYEEALRLFTLLSADTISFSNPAKFYMAITLMKRNGEGDIAAAKKVLQDIRDHNLDGKDKAVEWLNKLE